MDSLKIDSELILSVNLSEEEREKSQDLNVGYEKGNIWELIVRYNNVSKKEFEALNAKAQMLLGGYAIVRIPEQNIKQLAMLPGILYIEKPKKLKYELEYSKVASCITPGKNGPGAKGVIVGIIDTGIDYRNSEFIDDNGNSRIGVIFDEGSNRIYYREDIDNALIGGGIPEIDLTGHGTKVAGIAAGNSGIAYESEIAVVKLGEDDFFNTARLMEGVNFLIEYAINRGMPIAINISIGNNYGAHDGTSLLETYLDYVSNIWKTSIIVGSGNEANKRNHTTIDISTGINKSEFIIGNFENSVSIQMWKKYWDEFEVILTDPSQRRFALIKQPGNDFFENRDTLIYAYKGDASPYSTDDEILIELIGKDSYVTPGIWSFLFLPQKILSGIVDIYLTRNRQDALDTGFVISNPDNTLTIPSTSYKVITVGAYNAAENAYADFSGRGYTKNLVSIKPDIVAPGVDILTPIPGGGYTLSTGTSFATPFVTGAAALLMEWGIVEGNNIYMYGEKLKAELIKRSKKLNETASIPDERTGWGKLCLNN